MTVRVIVGFATAAVIAVFAWRRALLSASGSLAAVAMGTLAVLAGVRWGVLLVVYFVAATALSTWRHAEKSARTASIVDKRGARDALQVFANGAVFVLAALVGSDAAGMWGSDFLGAAALGALAASMADTAATEVGGAVGAEPRSIITGQQVAAGLSGGVTLAGSIAMLFGSAAIGTFALLLGFGGRVALAAFAGGIAGALADSLLGAVLQEKRQCPACGSVTERGVHDCRGVAVSTVKTGGVRGFDNDWVNLTSTVIGAVAAGVLSLGGV